MRSLDLQFFSRHLDDEEEVIEVIHKHWLLGVQSLFWPTASFLVSWYFLYLVPFRGVFYGAALWSIFSLVWWLRNFFDYYLDAWIVTTEGIIDVEWHGWFHRESTRVLYSDIQGVSYEIHGVTGTLLRYGTVSVEKISTGEAIAMECVPYPRAIESLVLKNMERYLHSKNLKNARHVQELLSELVTREIQLQELGDEDSDPEE